jgi:hypothetical protein
LWTGAAEAVILAGGYFVAEGPAGAVLSMLEPFLHFWPIESIVLDLSHHFLTPMIASKIRSGRQCAAGRAGKAVWY